MRLHVDKEVVCHGCVVVVCGRLWKNKNVTVPKKVVGRKEVSLTGTYAYSVKAEHDNLLP